MFFSIFIACTDKVYDALPYLEKLIPLIDENLLLDEKHFPICPQCNKAELCFNLRGGAYYVESRHIDASHRLEEWLESDEVVRGSLLVLDIGSGFNTPGVVRLRTERIAANHKNANFIRINKFQPGNLYFIFF